MYSTRSERTLAAARARDTLRPEEDALVVAEHVARATFAQHVDDVVAEAVLVDRVAGAEQLVDVAHAVEGETQGLGVAVDVGDDAEAHALTLPSPGGRGNTPLLDRDDFGEVARLVDVAATVPGDVVGQQLQAGLP